MTSMLSKIFGPNWRTSTSGILTVFAILTAYVINEDHSMVAFLPDSIEPYIIGVARLIAVVGGVIFAITVKDSHVTGGSIPQTPEAESRVKK